MMGLTPQCEAESSPSRSTSHDTSGISASSLSAYLRLAAGLRQYLQLPKQRGRKCSGQERDTPDAMNVRTYPA